MKITIKNLKTMRGRDWPAVDCDVCLSGKAFATAHDDGNGGGLWISPTGTNNDSFIVNKGILNTVEDYVKNTHNIELDEFVDNLIDASLKVKEGKKIEKDFQKGICFGYDTESFVIHNWKKFKTLKDLAADPRGKAAIQKAIVDIKKELKPDQKILNADVLKSMGFKL